MRSRGFLTGTRVLVVENEWIIADELCHVLRSDGAEVVGPAGSVAHALSLVKESKVHVAVLDVHLGDNLDAYPVAELLFRTKTPFLFATGYDSISIRREFANIPCLRKPFAPDIISQILNVVLVSFRQIHSSVTSV